MKDCTWSIKKVKHLESPEPVESAFICQIEEDLERHILAPLCQNLETDLRLEAHSHLQLDDRNPFKVGKVGDASAFLSLQPIPFMGGRYIHVKAKVEAYLQKTFYNLTTVALHNWRTYGQMRALATHKYKVNYFPRGFQGEIIERCTLSDSVERDIERRSFER